MRSLLLALALAILTSTTYAQTPPEVPEPSAPEEPLAPPPAPQPTPMLSGAPPVAMVQSSPPAPPVEKSPVFAVKFGPSFFTPTGALENIADQSVGWRISVGVPVSRNVSVIGSLQYIGLNEQSFAPDTSAFAMVAAGVGVRASPRWARARPYVEGTIGPRMVRFVGTTDDIVMSSGGLGVSVGMGVHVDLLPPVGLDLGFFYGGATDSASSGFSVDPSISLEF